MSAPLTARSDAGGEEMMGEINTTPLVDVMLVLLIIFMVTAPMFTHAVRVDLPRAESAANVEKPDRLDLSIDATGRIYWNAEVLSLAQLRERLDVAARAEIQPEVQLRADREVRYEIVAQVISAVRQAGIRKLGFVTDPADRGGR